MASALVTTPLEWREPSPQPALAYDAVHLWRADLDAEAAGASGRHRSWSEEERARGARFRFARDRDRYLAGRGLLREILANYLGAEPGQLSLGQGSHGKPFVAGQEDLRFNVSHAGASMLVAVADAREVGVDIEHVATDVSVEELADTILSRPELRILNGLGRESSQAAFLVLWTRKEAYLKADGRGLSLPPRHIDVSSPEGAVALFDELTGEWTSSSRWTLQTPAVGPHHVSAVAAEGRGWRLCCFRCPSARK